MKTVKLLLLLTGFSLASCEKSQTITPASLGVNKTVHSDSLKAVNNETEPPIVPVTGGGPR